MPTYVHMVVLIIVVVIVILFMMASYITSIIDRVVSVSLDMGIYCI